MKIWHEVWDYIKMIIIVVAIVLVINNVVLINAKIPSPSMEKTIMTGDRIFGFRMAYGLNFDSVLHMISIWICLDMRFPKKSRIPSALTL